MLAEVLLTESIAHSRRGLRLFNRSRPRRARSRNVVRCWSPLPQTRRSGGSARCSSTSRCAVARSWWRSTFAKNSAALCAVIASPAEVSSSRRLVSGAGRCRPAGSLRTVRVLRCIAQASRVNSRALLPLLQLHTINRAGP